MPRIKYATDADRIRRNVVQDENGCWNWQLYRTPAGYGLVRKYEGRQVTRQAHRISYEAFVGEIPAGLHLDHLCRNRACVNPDHLEPVTCQTNLARSPLTWTSINASKVECPSGHPYSGDNLRRSRGDRNCRTCARDRRTNAALRAAGIEAAA